MAHTNPNFSYFTCKCDLTPYQTLPFYFLVRADFNVSTFLLSATEHWN